MASIAFPDISKKATLSDGATYGYVRVLGSTDKPTLLFLHGFPSAAYDWRHQINHFSKQGYGLLVPDLLGYGDTSKPKDLKAYTMASIGRQVVELLDCEKLTRVIAVAHDWGCPLLSSLARFHADRYSAFVFCSVGYAASAAVNIDAVNKQTEQNFGYPLFGYWKFHEQLDAGALIDARPQAYASVLFPADPKLWKDILCPIGKIRDWVEHDRRAPRPAWLSEEELATHHRILGIGGHDPPLNWYRAAIAGLDVTEEADLRKDDRYIRSPTLFIRTEQDLVCLPDLQLALMKPYVRNLKVASVDSTHWLMLEKPDETNGIIQDFIVGLGRGPSL